MLETPAIGMGGLAPNKPVAKAIMLTSWQHFMDSVAERSKAVAQDATPPLSLLHTKQIGAGGPKPRHHSFFFLLLDVFMESPSSQNHKQSGAAVSVLGS